MKQFAKFLGIGPSIENNSNIQKDSPDTKSKYDLTVESSANGEVEILSVPLDKIVPNPFQPRKIFNEESLQELADSIGSFGVIQPLLVRRVADEQFELIAGERRLRASSLAGLSEVPVIVRNYNNEEIAALAMIENLQREDLHFLEEADGYQKLLTDFGLTQEELAKRVGKNQSTIANKLRILKLSDDLLQSIYSNGLTERHARALLKISDIQSQRDLLTVVIEKQLNVRETEHLIEERNINISQKKLKAGGKQKIVKIIRDVRIFLNTIDKVVSDIRKAGLKIQMLQEQNDDYIFIKLQIPKRK